MSEGRILYPWWYTVAFVYVNLAEAVVMALTFGLFQPSWGIEFAFWWATRSLKKRQATAHQQANRRE